MAFFLSTGPEVEFSIILCITKSRISEHARRVLEGHVSWFHGPGKTKTALSLVQLVAYLSQDMPDGRSAFALRYPLGDRVSPCFLDESLNYRTQGFCGRYILGWHPSHHRVCYGRTGPVAAISCSAQACIEYQETLLHSVRACEC